MSDELDLDAVKARLAAATKVYPAPWIADGFYTEDPDQVWSADKDYAVAYDVMGEGVAEFIANAPTDLAALVAEVERLRAIGPNSWTQAVVAHMDRADKAEAAVARVRDAIAAGEASDGHHTHNELYAYRLAYNAALFNEWLITGRYPVVKSWVHSDGEPCFGGGWFVVVATLPTGQISNHYQAEHWDKFRIPVAVPPTYDGHTPAEALARLTALDGDTPTYLQREDDDD